MSMFSLTRSSLVNIDGRRNESNICYECLVRLLNDRLTKVLQVGELCFVITSSIITFAALLFATVNDVVFGRQIPDNDLAVEATTHQHICVIWMPFYGGDFNRCFKKISKSYDIAILEIENQQLRVK